MRWAGHVARMWERRCSYRILGGKSVGRRPLGRPRLKWEDNTKIYLQEIGWVGAWTGLIWLRRGIGEEAVVNALMDLKVPLNAGNFLPR